MVVFLVNQLANMLTPGPLASRIRVVLFNMLGNRISLKSRMAGGGFIYGRQLSIGPKCFVGRNCYFDLTHPVEMESDVVIGHGVTFVTANHEIGPPERRCGPVKAAPIKVCRGSWIGANVTILPGVTIGAGAVVAAGALVTRDVAASTLVAGAPARQLRVL
ncbi:MULTISPECIES: DapH/DapD/GlmU-related protein [unclassified Novosphingobium]|uniref:acyltransferase n=1 Tax=unclassified Novosphingobium TaxID=2644732 RepID=UPI00135A29EF|nr:MULTISPECIES: acyltransferase [unclassified Novosphingobium]